MKNKNHPTDAEWAKMDEFARLLWVYEVTRDELQAAVPDVLCTLPQDALDILRGADLEHPETLTDDQAAVFSTLLQRAAAKLSMERAQRERNQAGTRN